MTGGFIMEIGLLAQMILQMINICAIVRNALCRTGDRGCKCRKTAGEESPGFTGQDAG